MNQQVEPVIINETGLSDEEIRQLRSMGFEVAEQGSEAWLQERLGLPTASRFFDITNWTVGSKYVAPKPQRSYYAYQNELLAERLTGERKRFSTKYTEWGKDHEEDAAAEYERITGRQVRTLGFIRHPELDCGASLDREVGDDGLLELKCPNTDTMIDYVLNGCPPMYYTQMQGQMWIAHKKWGDFGVFDPLLGKMYITRIDRDEEFIEVMERRIVQFLSELDRLELKLRGDGYGRTE